MSVFGCVTLYTVQNDLDPLLYTILHVCKENYKRIVFARGGGKRDAGLYRRTVVYSALNH